LRERNDQQKKKQLNVENIKEIMWYEGKKKMIRRK